MKEALKSTDNVGREEEYKRERAGRLTAGERVHQSEVSVKSCEGFLHFELLQTLITEVEPWLILTLCL